MPSARSRAKAVFCVSFGAWLRRLPLTPAGTSVLSFRGDVILPSDHENLAALAALDVGASDLQQCADSVVRLAYLVFTKKQQLPEWQRMVASLYRGHVVVVGLGKVGYQIIKGLLELRETVVVLFGVFAASLCIYPFMGVAFFPQTDAGQFTVNIKVPTGTRLEVTNEYVAKLEDLIRHHAEADARFAFADADSPAKRVPLSLRRLWRLPKHLCGSNKRCSSQRSAAKFETHHNLGDEEGMAEKGARERAVLRGPVHARARTTLFLREQVCTATPQGIDQGL